MLVGRAAEIGILDDLTAGARVGRAGTIVLRGEAGIGKTALLTDTTGRAATGPDPFTVLRTQGHEVETHVSFGGLATLLAPILPLVEKLPEVQAAALAGALRLRGTSSPGDRLGVATALLGLIAAAAERSPVLVAVDDAHWLDLPSLEAIVFAARRLRAEHAAVLIAARPAADADPDAARWLDSLRNLPVPGLPEPAARELLARHIHPLDPSRLRRHLTETSGNPLALLELAEHPAGGSGVVPVPIGARLEQAFGARLRRCPMSARKALLLLAVCGGEIDALRHLLETQGLAPAAIDAAETAGLVHAEAGEIRFRHPLMRSAVYQLATPGERREAHRAMALVMASLDTPSAAEREVWHLAAATTLPDERTAVRLEQAARAAADRRSYATAMDMYELSGRLSPPGEVRAGRLLTAAEVSMQAGRTEAGLALLDRLGAETDDPGLLTRAVHLRCRIEMWAGKPVLARDRLLDEGRRLTGSDPILAAVMTSHASLLTTMLGELSAAQDASETAAKLVEDLPDGVVMPILAVHALVLASRGQRGPARALLERCRPYLDSYDPLAADQVLLIAAQAFDAIEDPAQAHRWYRRAVDAALDAGAVGLLPFQLSALALAHWRQGAWAAALSTADEAVSFANETGWRTEMPNSMVALALVEAGMGRETDCRSHSAGAVRLAVRSGARVVAARADTALALLDLGAGRSAAAATRLDRVATFAAANDLGDPLLLSWAADAVEAGVRSGRRELTDRAYSEVLAEAERSGRPTALAREARCRALLTEDPDTAEAAIEEALAHHQRADWPFEEARTLLVQGELLRRHRHRVRAREALQRGVDLFEMLGAAAFADRTALELRAVGGRSRTPAATTQATTPLTPQETNVALVVASGATNAEAAARLFLSQKTIEYHLSSVYRKLGIRSRSQLVSAVSVWGPERDQMPATGT
jgi:DNA-binding CsgD family transcriptional regulator/tetratricopeptide (TPR) repeat protein